MKLTSHRHPRRLALGHFMMAFEPLLLFALVILILGNGAFKPNMSTQVGELYRPGDPRRDRAYSIFYVGINVGAFLAPLVCGMLRERVGWHYGFAAAGVAMLIALTTYLVATPHLPPDPLFADAKSPDVHRPTNQQEWHAVVALLLLFLPTSLFWACYEQQGNTIALWAADHTDRIAEIPITWFQADFCVHAVRGGHVGASGATRHRTVACRENGARLRRLRNLLSRLGSSPSDLWSTTCPTSSVARGRP
jgi:dipeptide/tripeptide permease